MVIVEEKIIDTCRIDRLRWLTVLLQAFAGTAMAYVYCTSVYVGPLSTEFGWDPSVIVLAYSAMMVVGLPGSAVGGKLKEKFGNRMVLKIGGVCFGLCIIGSALSVNAWMFVILYGILASFFMYVTYVAQLANIGELFPDKRGLAMGLVIGGINLGSALIAPLSEYLTRIMDIRYSIGLQGIVYGALVVLVGFLMIEAPKGYRPKGWNPEVMDPEHESSEAKALNLPDLSWKEVLKRKSFWLVVMTMIVGSSFLTGYQGNFSLVAQEALGVSPATAAWLYSLFMVLCAAAGVILGGVSDKFFGPLRTMGMWYCIAGVVIIAFVVTGGNEMWAFILAMIFMSCIGGSVQALLPTFTMDAYGSRHFGINYGFFLAAMSIGSIIGPQLAVRFSAIGFFGIGIVLLIIAAAFMFIARVIANKESGMKLF